MTRKDAELMEWRLEYWPLKTAMDFLTQFLADSTANKIHARGEESEHVEKKPADDQPGLEEWQTRYDELQAETAYWVEDERVFTLACGLLDEKVKSMGAKACDTDKIVSVAIAALPGTFGDSAGGVASAEVNVIADNWLPAPDPRQFDFTRCNLVGYPTIVADGADWVELLCPHCERNCNILTLEYFKGVNGLWRHLQDIHGDKIVGAAKEEYIRRWCIRRRLSQEQVAILVNGGNINPRVQRSKGKQGYWQ